MDGFLKTHFITLMALRLMLVQKPHLYNDTNNRTCHGMKSSIYLYIFYDISDKVLQGPQ